MFGPGVFRASRLVAATAAAATAVSLQSRSRRLACDYAPANRPGFPNALSLRGSDFLLVASGTRKVTFLNISVYDVGLYVAAEDVARLNARLRDLRLDSEAALRAHLADPVAGAATLDACIAEVSLAVRLTPVRNTDIAHMRDGFVRGVLAREDPAEDVLTAFKEFFPSPRKAFKREEVMLLTSWRGDRLELEIDGHDYGSFDTRGSPDARKLVAAFIATYVSGKKVACEPLRTEFIQQVAHEAL